MMQPGIGPGTALSLLLAGTLSAAPEDPMAVPTFHCIGLYWSPSGGSAERNVLVRYRRRGDPEWKTGFPLRYNPIPGTDEDLADYRGSLVHLDPGTFYEIELTLAGTSTAARLSAATWSERFPEGRTVRVGSSNVPLTVAESGSPQAWRVYDGRGSTIDVRHRHDSCIVVRASYVILRGFSLRGAGRTDTPTRKPIGAILIEEGHDIIIEDCDISDWGRTDPQTGFGIDYDSAILCRHPRTRRLIIQRCRLHHPASDSNNWHEPKYPTHPQGPQGISLFNTDGNHVIRYNECWSDPDHMFNDVIGGGENASYRGSPGHDSDIYGNFISHAWDDGLEVEGGNRNVRVWGNYITQCLMSIGNAATSIGPLYVWRNVAGRCQAHPGAAGGYFLKMGFAVGEEWMTGHQYIFHNTLFRQDEWLPTGGLGGSRIVKHTISRNNILHVRSPRDFSASANERNADNNFDYDLFNGRVPPAQEVHGIRGEPLYEAGSGWDEASRTGRFRLAPESPGAGAGQPLPNFSPTGRPVDPGAHLRGEPPMRFGVAAGRP